MMFDFAKQFDIINSGLDGYSKQNMSYFIEFGISQTFVMSNIKSCAILCLIANKTKEIN